MFKDNKFFEDFSKLTGSAFVNFSSMKQDFENMTKDYVKSYLSTLDFVNREEFDALKDMIAKVIIENDSLKQRITTLEEKLK